MLGVSVPRFRVRSVRNSVRIALSNVENDTTSDLLFAHGDGTEMEMEVNWRKVLMKQKLMIKTGVGVAE
jgi:hypothetical protein